jgi:hypothetical protein
LMGYGEEFIWVCGCGAKMSMGGFWVRL